MVNFTNYDVELDITSELIYWDNHTGPGPTTFLNGSSDTSDGTEFINGLISDAIDKIQRREGFFTRFAKEFSLLLEQFRVEYDLI